MCGRKWNLIQEEENRLRDRLVAAVVVHGKLDMEGNQKSEKVNKKQRRKEVMSMNAYFIAQTFQELIYPVLFTQCLKFALFYAWI